MLSKSPHLTVRDNQANIVNTAQVEVFEAGTTNTVTVFSDSAGQSELTQPFPVTSKGVIQFYADGGLYDVKITNDGDVTTITDIQIGNSQSKDVSGDGGDVLTSIYQEQPNEPTSNNVVWVDGYLNPRPTIFAWDSTKALQIDIGDNEPVSWTPRDHGDISLSNTMGGFMFQSNGKLVTVANKNAENVLVEMDEDFSNLVEIETGIRAFSQTDRGVLFVSGEDLKQVNSDLTISTVCTGLPIDGVLKVDESGLYVTRASGKTVGVYDVSGSSSAELRSYDASTESPSNSVEDAFYANGKVYFKGVAGTFDKSYYSFDVSGTDSAVLVGADAAFIGSALQKNGVIAFPYGGTFNFTDGTNSFSFGADDTNTVVDYIISFDGTNVVFVSPDNNAIYKYDITTGTEVESVAFQSVTTRKTGDKIYSIDNAGTTISVFDDSSFTVTEYTNLDYNIGSTADISFTDAFNPKRVSKVFLNGSWFEIANNNLANGLLTPSQLGQDLNKLNQDHPETGEATVYLQTNDQPSGFTGASSVVIGDDAYGEPGQPWDNSVIIGSGAGVGGDDNSMSGNGIAIGNGSYAYNLYSTAIGDGAYAEHYVGGITAGSGPLAYGNGSYVDGIESVALGGDTYISASNGGATAVGFGASVYGDYGVSVGHNSQNYGTGGVAVGQDSYNNNTDGVALGRGANNNHDRSVSLGSNTSSSEADTVAIGDRNLDIQGNGRGLIMRSPDGTVYDVTVDNTGTLQVASRSVA